MQKKLNGFLADLVVESHKIQGFHWYVKGPDFFQAHAQLETYYNEVSAFIDEVAEIMLMREMKPYATLEQFSKNASIAEGKAAFITSKEAYAELAKDFETMLESAKAIKEQAEKDGDKLIEIKADAYIEYFSKAIWMLNQH